MIIGHGAESIIEKKGNSAIKTRVPKGYRILEIDNKLRQFRTRREAKILEKLSSVTLVPKVIDVDDKKMTIEMEYIDGEKLVDVFESNYSDFCNEIAKNIAKIHNADIIHGDLTTSNMIFCDSNNTTEEKIYFIDFGLSYQSKKFEDKAVDLHLLFQALESKHYKVYDDARKIVLDIYLKNCIDGKHIINRLLDVEKRGKNKH
ncbi:MAG: KEOPS complex kinase/ATPase Bud32 [Candidatus Woesearchaeota archaeon]|jgi:TP53 regulating kinase-like protein